MVDVNAPMMVIRKLLNPDEGAPVDTRFNFDEDVPETSTDGGTTWVENPSVDPRDNPAYLLPPNTETDPLCAGAAGMVAFVRQWVDGVAAAFTLVGVANASITVATVLLPGVGWMTSLFFGVASAVLGYTLLEISDAFSEENYEKLLCIFYDHLEANGSITQAGWDAARTAWVAQIADTTFTGMMDLAYLLQGFVGFSNAGSLYADGEADCSTCPGLYDFDFVANGQQSWLVVLSKGQWDAGGSFFELKCAGGVGSLAECRIERGLAFSSEFYRVEADVNVIGAGIDEFNFFIKVAGVVTLAHSFGGASAGVQTLGGDITPVDSDYLRIDIADSNGCGSTDCQIFALRFYFN